MATEKLILFTRYPRPGKVKSRLIPRLGREGAADLQRRMTERVLSAARQVAGERSAELAVRFDGADLTEMRHWLGPDVPLEAQVGGDLGDRMSWAFREAFDAGARRVSLFGADAPELDAGLLSASLRALAHHDLVIGPARDGGYYLIGMRRMMPELFRGPCWGASSVLEDTLQLARGLGLRPVLLKALTDVDRPADLAVWEGLSGGGGPGA